MPSTYETPAVSFDSSSCHLEATANARRQELVHLCLTDKSYFLRIANSILRDQSDAEDAVQNSFCSAWQAVANFLGTAVTVERRRDEITNPCAAGCAGIESRIPVRMRCCISFNRAFGASIMRTEPDFLVKRR